MVAGLAILSRCVIFVAFWIFPNREILILSGHLFDRYLAEQRNNGGGPGMSKNEIVIELTSVTILAHGE